jgi:YesN/AraC family two-component response regulator
MKVIVVDDDFLFRMYLKTIIDWGKYGFELIGEAGDGNKALDLILRYEPDIVITDIKMPVMDGLCLIQKLNELKKRFKILILSNYDDFPLVKQAMKLGAEDYLLKLEIDPENLIAILKKMSFEIEASQQAIRQQLHVDMQIRNNQAVLRKNFLKNVISHFYQNEKDLKEAMDFLGIELNVQYIYCFMLKIGELYRFEEISNEELSILNSSIISMTEEMVGRVFNSYCFEGKTGEFYLFAANKENTDLPIKEQVLLEIGGQLNEMLEQYLNITVKIGIGKGQSGLAGIREAYNSAVDAIKSRFFKEKDAIILWNDIKKIPAQTEDYGSIFDLKENLYKALLFRQKEELEKVFGRIQDDILKPSLSKNSIINMVFELFYMVNEYCETYQEDANEIIKKSYGIYQRLLQMDNINEVKKWIAEIKQDLINYIGAREGTSYILRLILKAQKYIDDHFNEDISLVEVSDTVNLNPCYLTTLFKRYTNMSYSEYLTHIRMKKAKNLLEKSAYKVYEIGEMVGYQNPYYFNRIFKKTIGLSPGEYKKKVQ